MATTATKKWYTPAGSDWYISGGSDWYISGGSDWYISGGSAWYISGGSAWYISGALLGRSLVQYGPARDTPARGVYVHLSGRRCRRMRRLPHAAHVQWYKRGSRNVQQFTDNADICVRGRDQGRGIRGQDRCNDSS